MWVTKETPGELKCCHRCCKSLFSEEPPSLKTPLICVRVWYTQTPSEGMAPVFYKGGRGRTLLFQLIQRNAPLVLNAKAVVLLPVCVVVVNFNTAYNQMQGKFVFDIIISSTKASGRWSLVTIRLLKISFLLVYELKNYSYKTSWKRNLFCLCELWILWRKLVAWTLIFVQLPANTDGSLLGLETKAQATNFSSTKILVRPEVESVELLKWNCCPNTLIPINWMFCEFGLLMRSNLYPFLFHLFWSVGSSCPMESCCM